MKGETNEKQEAKPKRALGGPLTHDGGRGDVDVKLSSGQFGKVLDFCGRVTFLTCAIGSQVKVISQVEGCLLKEKVLLSEDFQLLATEQKETITNIILTALKEILVDQVNFKKQWKFCHQKGVDHPFGSDVDDKKEKGPRTTAALQTWLHLVLRVTCLVSRISSVVLWVANKQPRLTHLRSQLSSGDSLRCYPSEIRMQAV